LKALKSKYWKLISIGFILVLVLILFFYKNYFNSLVPFISSNYKIRGIDISHHNQVYDWDLVKSKNTFCIMKATEGNKMNDPKFNNSWKIAKNINLTRGAYHFFKSNSSAELQFENYRNSVKLTTNDMPPILDVEDDNIDMDQVNKWLSLAENYYGVKPIIYASNNYYIRYMQGKVNNYPVWLYFNTRYKLRPKFESNEVLFLQYSQHGKVNGINGDVDLDLFLGDKESFNKLLIK
jgi:lysozyme